MNREKKETLTIRFLYKTIPGRIILKLLTKPFLSKAAGRFLNSRLSRWLVPLFIKNMAIRYVYTKAALANTTTVTNIGNVSVADDYMPYIQMFGAFLAMSKGQPLKGTICSYGDKLMFTFSSVLADSSIQRGFFRRMSEDGLKVAIESNGVYYD